MSRGSREGPNKIKSLEESRRKVQTIQKNHKNKSDHRPSYDLFYQRIIFILLYVKCNFRQWQTEATASSLPTMPNFVSRLPKGI